MVNCEAGCGEKPKIVPVWQAIAETFTSGPLPWGETTMSERLQDVAGLVRARERMEVGGRPPGLLATERTDGG